jgi:hypothetical protein
MPVTLWSRISHLAGAGGSSVGIQEEAEMRHAITIRRSTEQDWTQIVRLAALDDRPAPRGDSLLGFVDGELRAAVPLGRGPEVADPFRLTSDMVELLRFRAGQEKAA